MAGLNRVAVVVVSVGLGVACQVDGDVGGEDVALRNGGIDELNSPHLNTPRIEGAKIEDMLLTGVANGPLFQGPLFQGSVLQGVQLNGPLFQGPLFQGPLFQGPLFQGTLFSGTVLVDGQEVPVEGTDFIGSEWNLQVSGTDANGNPVVEQFVLRIDDIDQSAEQDDVYLYDVVYRPASGDTWKPLCVDGANQPVAAIPLQNYWNLQTGDRIDEPNVFVFACTNAVLAKCVLWGYRPWATATRCKHQGKYQPQHCEEISLRDYHQTCTRMARADYCGDGTPWTIEGTAIDVADDLTPQIEFPTTNWTIEAEWTPEGAYCLSDMRQQQWKAEGKYPACFIGKKGKPIIKQDCGTMKKDRSMMTSTFHKL